MSRVDVLTTIQQARDDRKGKLDWAYSLGAIPVIDYEAFILANPRLNSRNKAEHDEAWKAFFKSDVGRIYRVSPPAHKVQRSKFTGIIIK